MRGTKEVDKKRKKNGNMDLVWIYSTLVQPYVTASPATQPLYQCAHKRVEMVVRETSKPYAIFLLLVIQVPNEINENPQVEVLDFRKENKIQKRRMQRQKQTNNWCI